MFEVHREIGENGIDMGLVISAGKTVYVKVSATEYCGRIATGIVFANMKLLKSKLASKESNGSECWTMTQTDKR